MIGFITDIVTLLGEAMGYAFMQRALLTGLITAVLCGVLSCWLVLIGWSLIGDAISHAVLPGIVISYSLGLPYTIGALVFALLTVWLIGLIRNQARILKEDAIIGTVFTPLLALGVVLVSVTPSQTDLDHILFGNLLGVTDGDLLQVAILGALALAVVLLKRRDLTLFAFDPMHARAIGLSPAILGGILLTSLAVSVVAALQAVGIVLVVAMLIVPGVTARLLTKRFWHMLWISPLVAAIATVIGVFGSYVLDASTGGLIVLVQGVLFVLVAVFGRHGPIARVLAPRRERRRADTIATDAALSDRL